MIILLVVAAVVVAAPFAAVVLVTIASLREDAEKSLTRRPPGWIEAAARRMLRVQPRGPSRQQPPRVPRQRTPDDDVAAKPRV